MGQAVNVADDADMQATTVVNLDTLRRSIVDLAYKSILEKKRKFCTVCCFFMKSDGLKFDVDPSHPIWRCSMRLRSIDEVELEDKFIRARANSPSPDRPMKQACPLFGFIWCKYETGKKLSCRRTDNQWCWQTFDSQSRENIYGIQRESLDWATSTFSVHMQPKVRSCRDETFVYLLPKKLC